MVAQPTGRTAALSHPPIPGAPTTAMPRQPGPDLADYPPGASPEARYYQDSHSRTGWYALAAFIALIALAAGGVLVYQSLTKAEEDTPALTLENYVNQPLESVTGALAGARPHLPGDPRGERARARGVRLDRPTPRPAPSSSRAR